MKLKKLFSTINKWGQKYWYIWLLWDIIKIIIFVIGGTWIANKFGIPLPEFIKKLLGG